MITKKEIIDIIEAAVIYSQYNSFDIIGKPDEPMWGKPIIGFARGDDPYFTFLKKSIGEFYWLPKDFFRMGTNESIEDDQLTVISVGFPQTKETKSDQKKAKGMPCNRWLYTRGEWENTVRRITDEIAAKLSDCGSKAVALDSIKEFSRHTSETFGIASNWSHRHTAFIAGLGTFGLSDGLITESGKAMRFTSIIIKGCFEPTKRPYNDHHAYCKFYSENKCGVCISRCPVKAITKDGHNKEKCSAYLQKIKNEIGPDFVKESNYISGCGLCQSGVPCQDKIPK